MPIDLSKTSTPFDPGALDPLRDHRADANLHQARRSRRERTAHRRRNRRRARALICTSSSSSPPDPTKGVSCGSARPSRATTTRRRRRSPSTFSARLPGPRTISARRTQGEKSTPSSRTSTTATLNKLRVIGKIGSRARRPQPDDRREVPGPQHRRRRRHEGQMKDWAQWGPVAQDIDDGLEGAMTSTSAPPVSSIDPPPWAD